MHTTLFIFHALLTLTVADVSHLNRRYLPPIAATENIADEQPKVQLDEVLRDEVKNESSNTIKDVQSLDNESADPSLGESSSDPFAQPGFGGFGGFPGAVPSYPGQGFAIPYPSYAGQFPGQGYAGLGLPAQGFPGQGYPGQGFPWQNFPGQGFPGQRYPNIGYAGQAFPGLGFPGQSFPGQGFPGQGFPGQGFPGQGFPLPVSSFPGVPYQASNQQKPVDVREPPTRVASDAIHDANGGCVCEKPN